LDAQSIQVQVIAHEGVGQVSEEEDGEGPTHTGAQSRANADKDQQLVKIGSKTELQSCCERLRL